MKIKDKGKKMKDKPQIESQGMKILNQIKIEWVRNQREKYFTDYYYFEDL